MEKEVRTFRDKVGIVLTTLGISSLIIAVMALVSWLFTPEIYRSQINIIKPLVVLVFGGIALIRLSLLTIKKQPGSS